jgi:hypothetical protein
MLVTIRDKVAKLKQQSRSLDETIAAKPTAAFDAKWGQFVITPAFSTPTGFTRASDALRINAAACVHLRARMVDSNEHTRTTDLVQKLQIARRELKLEAAINRLDCFDLLILDDFEPLGHLFAPDGHRRRCSGNNTFWCSIQGGFRCLCPTGIPLAPPGRHAGWVHSQRRQGRKPRMTVISCRRSERCRTRFVD